MDRALDLSFPSVVHPMQTEQTEVTRFPTEVVIPGHEPRQLRVNPEFKTTAGIMNSGPARSSNSQSGMTPILVGRVNPNRRP
ncbi:hypothetical protein RPC_3415 [Rhodopseudomonas palustris BisB18]|uniref:Uncharacterized protein n=1 Tax=Rhodopseudomonas palustris (strain BisB18) TaxID=316056 RepID=Q211I1_RHOPB